MATGMPYRFISHTFFAQRALLHDLWFNPNATTPDCRRDFAMSTMTVTVVADFLLVFFFQKYLWIHI